MSLNAKKILLGKIFDITAGEWPRVYQAWLINFLYKIGFVIGWTVLVSMFVSRYGIESLPMLFILNAAFAVIGSIFYASLLDRFGVGQIMIATIFAAGTLLFFAMKVLPMNEVLFFGLAIVAVAVFLNQFKITLGSYIEEMFTPLESERTFPLIEAAETIGGIVAGLIITFFALGVDIANFIYLWMAILFLIVPFLLSHRFSKGRKIPKDRKGESLIHKIKKAFSDATRKSYVKGLFSIVFFQWLLFNLLEFQYTKAVFENVSTVVRDAGSGFEHALFHDLGILFVLFSSSALVIQLFVGGRLINYLGITGSMLLHPIVTLLSLFGLTAKFNFLTAVLTKNNFTITAAIHNNAYHSSYYAVREDVRSYVRELLEGVVRPIGAMAGTLVLIFLQRTFTSAATIFYVNLAMVLTAVILFCVIFVQQRRYTQLAIDDLLSGKTLSIRCNAVEILAQRGHRYYLNAFRKVLHNRNESLRLRLSVIEAIKGLTPLAAIPDLTKLLNDKDPRMRAKVIDALRAYKALVSRKYLVSKYHLTNFYDAN